MGNSVNHAPSAVRRSSASFTGGRKTNYCAGCQTGGKPLKDRALSKLLRDDWPATLEELEEGVAARRKA